MSLPATINGVNEEYSGITLYKSRVYLLPQYGNHKETKTDGEFNIYSLLADSINSVIMGKDSAVTTYRTIKVKNLDRIPTIIKQNYQGFESITIVNGQVYMAMETPTMHYYCYLFKGVLDTVKSEINLDAKNYISLRRIPYIENAGFESVAYLSKEKKLLAYYEFNGMPGGGIGYLIDPSFKKSPQQIKAPFLYFRVTDIATTTNDRIYGINYYYNGDYDDYLNNGILKNREDDIKKAVPNLKDKLIQYPDYLKNNTYARIVTLKSYKDKQWQPVTTFDGEKSNWEGITLFGKGALIITDANRSTTQLSSFAYIEF
ncbi:hypothetical protein GCM10027049_28920 [Mucilaginibacter puniceus]